jgi:hypothetical protein
MLLQLNGLVTLGVISTGKANVLQEQEHAATRQMPPNGTQPPQDGWPLRVSAAELALDAPRGDPPFSSTRPRCSRLMARTMRCLTAWSRRVVSDQRPYGRPTTAGDWSASRQRVVRWSAVIRGGAPPRGHRRTQASPSRSKACMRRVFRHGFGAENPR